MGKVKAILVQLGLPIPTSTLKAVTWEDRSTNLRKMPCAKCFSLEVDRALAGFLSNAGQRASNAVASV
jgi:hypothetical protein